MTVRILIGDVRERLRDLPDESVHCVVTSPPYFGLRDYGHAGQIGLEPTPDAFVATMVEVFREVRRVLRKDGTLWLNLGDSYAGGGTIGRNDTTPEALARRAEKYGTGTGSGSAVGAQGTRAPVAGLKAKDLIGIPWSVAKALQAPYYTGQIKSERDRVWLAAILDGEGTICGFSHERKDDGRTRTGVHLFVTNSCDALLNECGRIWPTSRSEHMIPSEGHLGTKRVDRWIPHGASKKARLLAELYPYLITKREQAHVGWNLLQFVMTGKRDGHEADAVGIRAKRQRLTEILSDLNNGRGVDLPSWLLPMPSLYEPGWYLRQDLIWAKPNPMPESVRDRCTKAHEYLFLLTRSERYWFDGEAISEPASVPEGAGNASGNRYIAAAATDPRMRTKAGLAEIGPRDTRNKRSVWTITTQPFSEAHFATFPPELPELCIKAGTSERGCCPHCGAGWVREVERTPMVLVRSERTHELGRTRSSGTMLEPPSSKTLGWVPACRCHKAQCIACIGECDCTGAEPIYAGQAVPAVVLDPFGGAGTTGLVADRLGRNAVLIELNPQYAAMAEKRIHGDAGMFAMVAAE